MMDLKTFMSQMLTPGTVPCTLFGAALGLIFAVLCLTVGVGPALLIALFCLIGAIIKATENALRQYPHCEVIFAGGVSSNTMLRERCRALPAVFCAPEFSTDNAMGTAILTWRAHNAGL